MAAQSLGYILASVAEYENEVRSERIRAGQAAARARGVTWGGSTEGRYVKVTRDQERMIVKLVGKGEKIAVIARTTGLSRPTITASCGTRKSRSPLEDLPSGMAQGAARLQEAGRFLYNALASRSPSKAHP